VTTAKGHDASWAKEMLRAGRSAKRGAGWPAYFYDQPAPSQPPIPQHGETGWRPYWSPGRTPETCSSPPDFCAMMPLRRVQRLKLQCGDCRAEKDAHGLCDGHHEMSDWDVGGEPLHTDEMSCARVATSATIELMDLRQEGASHAGLPPPTLRLGL
jgi:hypothetical protein